MDALDLVTKIVNLPAIGLLVYYVLAELREQRRELRRARGEDRQVLDSMVAALATLVERSGLPKARAAERSKRHNAPAFGVVGFVIGGAGGAAIGAYTPGERWQPVTPPPPNSVH